MKIEIEIPDGIMNVIKGVKTHIGDLGKKYEETFDEMFKGLDSAFENLFEGFEKVFEENDAEDTETGNDAEDAEDAEIAEPEYDGICKVCQGRVNGHTDICDSCEELEELEELETAETAESNEKLRAIHSLKISDVLALVGKVSQNPTNDRNYLINEVFNKEEIQDSILGLGHYNEMNSEEILRFYTTRVDTIQGNYYWDLIATMVGKL